MRVLFVTLSEKSHVYAMAPLGWAMAAAGHEVRMASNPAMAPVIAGTGLTAVSVGVDHPMHDIVLEAQQNGMLEKDYAAWTEISSEALSWDEVLLKSTEERMGLDVYSNSMVHELVEFCLSWRPDLVVWDLLTFAGAVAARVCGAAHARLLWAADVYSTTRAAFLDLRAQDPARAGTDPLGEWLGGYLDRYGHEFDDEILNGQWSIDLLPASIQLPLPVPRVPVRYTPYNGPSIAPDWVLRPPEKPRVCLTPGVSFGVDSGYLPVRTVLDSLADLDVEVVATFDPDELPASDVPPNTRVTGFVPLHTLLPSCSVTVNHAGYGSWITAAYYGVPQFLLPIRYGDLMPVARNLESAGAALFADGATADAQQVRDGVLRLLSEPSFADDAGALRAEIMSTPSAAEIVPHLERLTITHRSNRSLV